MASILSEDRFHNEEAAYAWVEAALWPNGPVCYHCKGTDKIGKMRGETTRIGLYKCYACKKPFTVKMGTIFESSHVPMRMWLQGIYLMSSSKKGVSTRQLQRTFGCGLKTAWFMSHRIREAMRSGSLAPMGGGGAPVEVDETYIGTKEGRKKARAGYGHKRPVVSLVERGGEVRSFHVETATVATVAPIVRDNINRESLLLTDESRLYWKLGEEFSDHQAIEHGKGEYVRGDVHTNTVEGVFSIFKRGMYGVYQHCGQNHLHRYLAEFDFRYNNRIKLGVDDLARSENALKGAAGKRLTYRTTRRAKETEEAGRTMV